MKRVRNFISLLICGVLAFSLIPPTPASAAVNTTIRLGGLDRFETSIAIANEFVKNNPTDTVIIASAYNYPDSLASAPLTKLYNAPIMLTETESLNPKTEAQLRKMGIKKAIIVGGTGAVSENVNNRLNAIGITTERFGGLDRYETAMLIADRAAQLISQKYGYVERLIIATDDYNDVLTLGPVSTYAFAPIVLVERTDKSISDVPGFQTLIDKYTPADKKNNLTAIYTPDKLSAEMGKDIREKMGYSPVTGKGNKYWNNLSINYARQGDLRFQNALMANGENFPDALSGVALAGKLNAPIVFTGNPAEEEMPEPLKSQVLNLYRNNTKTVYYLGGEAVVPEGAKGKLE